MSPAGGGSNSSITEQLTSAGGTASHGYASSEQWPMPSLHQQEQQQVHSHGQHQEGTGAWPTNAAANADTPFEPDLQQQQQHWQQKVLGERHASVNGLSAVRSVDDHHVNASAGAQHDPNAQPPAISSSVKSASNDGADESSSESEHEADDSSRAHMSSAEEAEQAWLQTHEIWDASLDGGSQAQQPSEIGFEVHSGAGHADLGQTCEAASGQLPPEDRFRKLDSLLRSNGYAGIILQPGEPWLMLIWTRHG